MTAFALPPLPSQDNRWKIVNGTMRKNGFASQALVETLRTVQSSFGYIDRDAIRFVAASLRVSLSRTSDVAAYFNYFTQKPTGKHVVTICTGMVCSTKGTDKLLASAEKHLCISKGQTTKDGLISLTTVHCLGNCGHAPVILTDRELPGEMTGEQFIAQLDNWSAE
jgi:bidirectional [NiFe] hydrogenase diaphorase subunit